MIRILAFGDVVGKPGRKALAQALPTIKAELKPDFIIANGENAAGGFGITPKIHQYLTDTLGLNCITTGNHWADKREIYTIIDNQENLLIPANMGNVDKESKGLFLTKIKNTPIAIINAIGTVFMHSENRNPFQTVHRLLDQVPPSTKVRIIDFHAEATSEKQALAYHLQGQISLFYGTHTHVPTADERILKSGTGYISDIGMTGSYDSVIGMDAEAALNRFLTGTKQRLSPATKNCWVSYIYADIDEKSGKCLSINRKRLISHNGGPSQPAD